jgi:hypothetical protein
MGIDVFTAPLAVHLNHCRPSGSLGRDVYDLSTEGIRSWRALDERPMGVGAAWHAGRFARWTQSQNIQVGHRWSEHGPAWLMTPDRMDARCWGRLIDTIASVREGLPPSEARSRAFEGDEARSHDVFDDVWDDFPGIAFARAVETLGALIVPGMVPAPCFTGGLAVTATCTVNDFVRAAAEQAGLDMRQVDDIDGLEQDKQLNDLLYNLRLFGEHVRQAEALSLAIGVYG